MINLEIAKNGQGYIRQPECNSLLESTNRVSYAEFMLTILKLYNYLQPTEALTT